VRAGLEQAEKALAINARHATAALQAGALHLIVARAAGGDVRRREAEAAHDRLYAALGFDGNLERDARPLFDEATRLMTAR
jgi:hypothetical protein